MSTIGIDIYKTFFSPKVKSGDEFDYVYVENNGYYQFESYNKGASFVLPPNPEVGTTIYFSDGSGSTIWFPVKIHRNGNPIMGEDEHMICDIPNIQFSMRFVGGYVGWEVQADSRFTPKISFGMIS